MTHLEPEIARDWTKEHPVTHLEPGIGRGGEEEAGEAPYGVREGGKIYLTHTGLDKEKHMTHLEPGIGQGASRDPPGARDWTRIIT